MATPKTNGAFKLDSLKQVETVEEEGTWVDVRHPSGGPLYLGKQEKTPLRIKVAGRYSRAFRHAQKAAYKAAAFRDDDDQRGINVLSRVTLEWEGAFDDEGTPIPLTRENAAVLYKAAFFVAEQVDNATLEHERFFRIGLGQLMQFVAHEARMNEPVLDGEGKVKGSVRDELMGLWKRNPERYEAPPEVPERSEYLWNWYLDLRRASGEYVTWEGIDAWCRRMDVEPEPHEIDALLSIDAVYRNPPKRTEGG